MLTTGASVVVIWPDSGPAWLSQLAWPVGWISTMLCGVSVVRNFDLSGWRKSSVVGGVLLLVTTLVACGVGGGCQPTWNSYHVLVLGLLVTQFLLLCKVVATHEKSRGKWVFALWFGAAVLSIRGYAVDPAGYITMTGAIFFATVGVGYLAWLDGSRRVSYLIAVGAVLIGEFLWMRGVWGGNLSDLLNVCLLGLSGAAVVAAAIERKNAAAGPSDQTLPALREAVLAFNLVAIGIITGFGILSDITAMTVCSATWLTWVSLSATVVLGLARCWNPSSENRGIPVYAAGFLASLLALGEFHLRMPLIAAYGVFVLGTYLVLTGAIWRWRSRIQTSLSLPKAAMSMPLYFGIVHFGVAMAITLVAIALVLVAAEIGWSMRIWLGAAIFLPGLAIGIVARGTKYDARSASLGFCIASVVTSAWALSEPGSPGDTLLNRLAALLVVLIATTMTGTFLCRLHGRWGAAVARVSGMCAVAWMPVLAVILMIEICQRISLGSVTMSIGAIVVVALALLGASILMIRYALDPCRDPLKSSESSRMPYVYASEAAVFLIFVHARLTVPWLFGGFLAHYWTFIVMALAFAGAGLAEALRRKKTLVLAEPIEKTAAFLPLIPVLGFWAADNATPYFGVLFSVSLFYGILAIARKSFGACLLAALAGNAGLWFVWNQLDGFRFFQHPQLWLIPVALSGLAAAYLNRRHMSDEAMSAVRYASLIVVYASSSADIFINGMSNSLWLPIILGGLSVAGVFLGIALRVRAFLFLGASFLLLDLFAIIWHASDNLGWTWIWYVAGIGLGLGIIALFAVFEKKREAILKIIETLKQWE